MDMKERAELAVEYKKKMNCAQAVLLSYAEELGKGEEELMALGSGFGTGMGGMEATCGALCGAAAAAGLLYKGEKQPKMLMRDALNEFKERTGATICGDIKGIKTRKMLCSCDDCVRHAVYALENALNKA